MIIKSFLLLRYFNFLNVSESIFYAQFIDIQIEIYTLSVKQNLRLNLNIIFLVLYFLFLR